MPTSSDRWLVCPRCGMGYSIPFKRRGETCGDLSYLKGSEDGPPCPGRLRVSQPPRWDIRTRRGFCSFTVDLWPTVFNLNAEGQARCRAILEAAAREAFRLHPHRRRSIVFSHCSDLVSICNLYPEQLDGVRAAITAVIGNSNYIEPLHHKYTVVAPEGMATNAEPRPHRAT